MRDVHLEPNPANLQANDFRPLARSSGCVQPERIAYGKLTAKQIAQRFWPKVEIHEPNECWPWRGCLQNKGSAGARYGYLHMRIGPRYLGKQRKLQAHRLAWEMANGPIPDGMIVRHMCHNPQCCNPAHLEIGTHQDNMDDMARAGRSLAGERNPRARLTAEQVERAKMLRALGCSYKRIGDEFGVHLATIAYAVNGRTWRRSA